MPTPDQMKRWGVDWNSVKEIAGKKVDSIQFGNSEGSERLVIRFLDGIRLNIQADGGAVRAWLSCCGKPDGRPPEIK